MRIFDAHFHIIDFDFPIQENQGYTPPSYVVNDYRRETADLGLLVERLCQGHFRVLIKVIC